VTATSNLKGCLDHHGKEDTSTLWCYDSDAQFKAMITIRIAECLMPYENLSEGQNKQKQINVTNPISTE
jgi:hypothetical protein